MNNSLKGHLTIGVFPDRYKHRLNSEFCCSPIGFHLFNFTEDISFEDDGIHMSNAYYYLARFYKDGGKYSYAGGVVLNTGVMDVKNSEADFWKIVVSDEEYKELYKRFVFPAYEEILSKEVLFEMMEM